MARRRVESVSGSLIELASWPPEGLSETEVVLEGEPQSLVLLRQGESLKAWLNICPHAGRRLDWAPGKFLVDKGKLVCAAHGASFELQQGECVAGPCRGASLTAVRVAVAAG
ncbi:MULTISPECIES: Rieske (2Fe-2S) protein [unclassified Arenimonas]|uniref:Rieske (2Fe-2S) protein n=1 Tax=unclassified Arenimonas TaxID=2641713 RepID=UPI00086931C9|nr:MULTISPECIES: Rieske (2Fe-2S) protein [unclassified Arenimonas]ODS64533.1 MAG: ferredoxin [Arenimonas sp. SCN 70-307]